MRPAVVGEHQLPRATLTFVEELAAVRFVGDDGNAERERQRILLGPVDLGDLVRR